MSVRFKGVLAVIGTPTVDGRTLGELSSQFHHFVRAPIVALGQGAVGVIERVWVDENLLRYSGYLEEQDAAHVREKLVVGNLDADAAEISEGGVFSYWRVVAATLGPYENRAWPEVCMDLEANG